MTLVCAIVGGMTAEELVREREWVRCSVGYRGCSDESYVGGMYAADAGV
jgi:hypothetical protein